MKASAPRGRPIELSTPRFRLRSLRPSDVSERWQGWAADPEVMEPLNGVARTMPQQELLAYVRGFDDLSRHLVGVFARPDDLHIGFFIIHVHRQHANATFNVVIGDKAWWGAGVVNETRAALLTHVFGARGVERVTGTPIARNFPALFNYKAQGWRLEGVLRQSVRTVDGKRLDQYQFAMLRDQWRERLAGTGAS